MDLIKSIKEFAGLFDRKNWTDGALLKSQYPSLYYPDGSMGQPPMRYSITDPVALDPGTYRGGLELYRNDLTSSSNLMELFHCVPEIYAPIHAIASRIANADFQLRKWFDDEVIYNNKAWNTLYETPNPLQHFRELIYEAVVYELVTGNEYFYLNIPKTLDRNYTNVAAIWNLPSEQMEPATFSSLKLFSATRIEDIIRVYKLGETKEFEPEDILHIKSINLNWNDKKLKGVSPLCSAKKAIANLIAVYEARNVIYTKRGALGFIVSRKSDASGMVSLTPKEKESLLAEHQLMYGVTGGRSPFGLTEAPVDYVKVGATISELEPFKETLADAMAIYATLGVPRELMPQEAGSTYENQAAAARGFYNNVIIPKANMYMQSLSNKLGLTASRLYLHASFDHVDELQENKKEKADVEKIRTDTAKIRFMSGVITLNDWVIDAGYEASDNQLYEKRLFDMSSEEQALVMSIMKTIKPSTDGNQQQTEGNGGTTGSTGNGRSTEE